MKRATALLAAALTLMFGTDLRAQARGRLPTAPGAVEASRSAPAVEAADNNRRRKRSPIQRPASATKP